MEYAEMLGLTVSSCDLTIKPAKKRRKKDVKEDVENKCKNSVDNSKGNDYYDKLMNIYNSSVSVKEAEPEYVSRVDREKAAEDYFKKAE